MYDFKKIEKKWQDKWEKSKVFEVKEKSKKKKYYVLEQFLYPSGSSLHIGHSFIYTIGDIHARFKRLQGYNVLHPTGYDSLGLPAENAAIKEKIHPKKYTENSIKNFIKQQKRLGWSYDWSRMIKTHDSEFYKWDQWIFLQMLKKGLAYKKESPVNWCPECKTVLANEQVHDGKCWRHEKTKVEIKHLNQWYLKITDYAEELNKGLDKLKGWPDLIKKLQKNWIGKSYGTEINFKINDKTWKIFTTRPDTLFGVTFMVVSAQHPKLNELVTKEQKEKIESFVKKLSSVSEIDQLEKEGVFTGSYAIHPLTNEKIPVYAGNFVLADYGSGMVMAVPAHDQRDYEFAKKYKIPIIRVIAKNAPIKSYLMGGPDISDNDLKNLNIKIINKKGNGDREIEIPKQNLKKYENLIIEKLTPKFWNEYIGKEIVFIFKYKDGKTERFVLNKKTEGKIDKLAAEFMDEKWDKSCVWKWLSENKFYTNLINHKSDGILVNSDKFNGLESKEAVEEITNYLNKNKLGKKTVNFRLKDWLISRQRYWGTPIPIIYCDKCGVVPVPEKDLPLKLPDKIKFGKGNPLETNSSFVNVKCPKCKGKGRRETDTMDTFVNSSWYYLRYLDNKNSKKIFEPKKANYWVPIDMYIGGKEHACMHLIYIRFYTKFLRDLGLLKIDEPAVKLFIQGMIHGEDGNKMSKSIGNVVDPIEIITKYGADSLRLFLVSVAASTSNFNWSEKGVQGSFKFVKKVNEYFNKVKIGKSSEKVESKINKSVNEVTLDIENFRYNLAIIKIRQLFDCFESDISKKDAESFLKLISVFCPYLSEEIWSKLGNKDFISLDKWPVVDIKKINKKFDVEEQAIDKLKNDIENIKRITGKENPKVYVYVLPKEVEIYKNVEDIEVFSVADKKKYDPECKSKKAKPGKPAIFVE